jgi:hypothetical protein
MQKMYGVLLSRFTDKTLSENRQWKEANDKKCAYGSTRAISDNLPLMQYFVIEMNVTTNKIAGIGIIRNKLAPRVRIYSNPYFNRYIYIGKHFIPIEDLDNEHDKKILEEIEKILFYGKGHLKRGGMTLFPPKLLKQTYLDWLLRISDHVIVKQ